MKKKLNYYLKIIDNIETVRKKKQCKLDESFKNWLQVCPQRYKKNFIENIS